MPDYTIPYAPQSVYQPDNSIASLIVRAGQNRADAQRQNAAMWGNTLAQAGSLIGQGLQSYAETKRVEQEKQKQLDVLTKRDQAFVAEWQATNGSPSPARLVQIYGPKAGMEMAKDIGEWTAARSKGAREAFAALPNVVSVMDKVSPAMQSAIWASQLRPTAIEAGMDPASLPEQFDSTVFDGIRKLAETKGEDFTLGDTRYRADGSVVVQNREPQKPERIEVTRADGSKEYQWVIPEAGKSVPSAPRPTVAPKEDRVITQGGVNYVMKNGVATPVMGADGQPLPVPPSQLRPPNGEQLKSVGFFGRAQTAAEELDDLSSSIAGMGLAGQTRLALAPNLAQSEVGQRYIQARQAFTEAMLRRDSGAAISGSEYENADKTYFVQPGDSAAVQAQKAAARRSVLASLAYGSGSALQQQYGEEDAARILADYKPHYKPSEPPRPSGIPKPPAGRPKVDLKSLKVDVEATLKANKITMKMLEALAKAEGISVEEAAKMAKAQGLTVAR